MHFLPFGTVVSLKTSVDDTERVMIVNWLGVGEQNKLSDYVVMYWPFGATRDQTGKIHTVGGINHEDILAIEFLAPADVRHIENEKEAWEKACGLGFPISKIAPSEFNPPLINVSQASPFSVRSNSEPSFLPIGTIFEFQGGEDDWGMIIRLRPNRGQYDYQVMHYLSGLLEPGTPEFAPMNTELITRVISLGFLDARSQAACAQAAQAAKQGKSPFYRFVSGMKNLLGGTK